MQSKPKETRIVAAFALFAMTLLSPAAVPVVKASPEEGGNRDGSASDLVGNWTEIEVAPYSTKGKWAPEVDWSVDENGSRLGRGVDARGQSYEQITFYGLLYNNDAANKYSERISYKGEEIARAELAMLFAVKNSRAMRNSAVEFSIYDWGYITEGCTGKGDYKFCAKTKARLGPNAPNELILAHYEVLDNGSYNEELRKLGVNAREFGLDCCNFNQGGGGGGSGSSCKKLDTECVKKDQRGACRKWLQVGCLDCFDYKPSGKTYKKCLKKTGQIYTFADGFDFVCDYF